jgi:hypothetical protein
MLVKTGTKADYFGQFEKIINCNSHRKTFVVPVLIKLTTLVPSNFFLNFNNFLST